MDKKRTIELAKVEAPRFEMPENLPTLPDNVFMDRLSQFRMILKNKDLDCALVYGDREHFANFLYFANFEPRFEEGLLVIHQNKPTYVLLGNECFCMYKNMKIEVNPLLCQQFSLPNQPSETVRPMTQMMMEAGIEWGMKVGIVDWKLLPDILNEKNIREFSMPAYIVEGVAKAVGGIENLINVTDTLIHPEYGLRIEHTADEIAVFEYGAAWASKSVQNIVDGVTPQISEIDLADLLLSKGLPQTCHPIVASGENVWKGLISPTSRRIQEGDPMNVCTGLRGGLSCRAGYVAASGEQISGNASSFVDDVAKPYYEAVVAWYETIGIGVTGAELFETVSEIIPKKHFGWTLNPGHGIAEEEWINSPVYSNSGIKIRSGMLMQMDIIPSVEGYVSPNCEDGICIADDKLQQQLKDKYPEVWQRMIRRRDYMINVLGIRIKPEILPMSELAGFYRPYFLNRDLAFKVVS